MSYWVSLLKVTAVHEYYSWKTYRALEFSPTFSGSDALQHHQLLMKQHSGGFELLADFSGDIRTIEDTFRLYGYSSDPHFSAYTELPGGGGKPLYYRIECQGTEASIAEAESAPDLDDRDITRNRGIGIGQRRKPNLIVDVVMAKTLAPEVESSTNCAIEFKARQLYWKYILGGEFAAKDLEIRHFLSDTSPGFERCEQDIYRIGAVFQSTSPIALRESPPQRIQLVETSSGKVVIKRLPNAGPGQLGKSKDRNGNEVIVAEIYVNH